MVLLVAVFNAPNGNKLLGNLVSAPARYHAWVGKGKGTTEPNSSVTMALKRAYPADKCWGYAWEARSTRDAPFLIMVFVYSPGKSAALES